MFHYSQMPFGTMGALKYTVKISFVLMEKHIKSSVKDCRMAMGIVILVFTF